MFIPNDGEAFIAAYVTNFTFKHNGGGGLFYRQTSEPALLRNANSIVHSAKVGVGNFKATHLIIVTYSKAQNEQSAEHENTFQLVLAFHGSNTYVIAYYDRLDTQDALVGYNFPQCKWKIFNAFSFSTSMASTTNTNRLGQHVFHMTSSESCSPFQGKRTVR